MLTFDPHLDVLLALWLEYEVVWSNKAARMGWVIEKREAHALDCLMMSLLVIAFEFASGNDCH